MAPIRRRRVVARNRKRTSLRLGLLLLGALLLVGGVYGLVKLIGGRGRQAELQKAPFTVGTAYAYTGNGFLYYTDGKLVYKDDAESRNDYSLSVSTASGEPSLAAGTQLAALYNASSILIVGADAPVELSGTLTRVVCGKAHLAALTSGAADTLYVYDAKAALRDQLDFTGSYLTKFGLDAIGEETLWTLSLDVSGAIPISTVTTYNLASSVTNGLMSVQNELVEDVRFTAKSIFAVGTNHIIRYDRAANTEIYRVLCYGWRLQDFYAGTAPLFLFTSRNEEDLSSVRLYALAEADLPAEKVSTVQLPEGSLAAFLCGGKLAVFTPESLLLYDQNGGKLSEEELGMTLRSAVKVSPTKALLTAEDGTLYVLNIK